MILTTEQAERIRAAGGLVSQTTHGAGLTGFTTLAEIGGTSLLEHPCGGFVVTAPPTISPVADYDWFEFVDSAVSALIRWAPQPEPCNVLQFPMPSTTRLGAIESFLDRNADAAGALTMKIMYRLADLARRADNARKARRNG